MFSVMSAIWCVIYHKLDQVMLYPSLQFCFNVGVSSTYSLISISNCLQVQTAQTEAKIVSQYSELVKEAKVQFQKELSSITPEVQANWKGLSKQPYPSSCL